VGHVVEMTHRRDGRSVQLPFDELSGTVAQWLEEESQG